MIDFTFGCAAGVILGIVLGMMIYREGYQIAKRQVQMEQEDKGNEVTAWIK